MNLNDFDETFLVEEGIRRRDIEVDIRADVAKRWIVAKLTEFGERLKKNDIKVSLWGIGKAKYVIAGINARNAELNADVDRELSELASQATELERKADGGKP